MVDDHAMARANLRSAIEKAEDLIIVGEAADGKQAVKLAQTLQPDVALLDYRLPKMAGPAVAEILQAMQLPTRILAVSAHANSQYVQAMLRAGAAGYLLKEEAQEKIIEAVQAVAKGKAWYSQAILTMISSREQETDSPGLHVRLSKQEKAILQGIARGWNNERIADEMNIEQAIVESNIKEIYKKLDVDTRAKIVAMAWKLGLIL